ncbi:ATP-dependent nuclease [Variovorax sp. LT1R16]|uniref:ATP-dependent nuclease n=1 Tax=Variovorax sp. LT1R16 TaxID=3443728 RepID=UPI003F46A64B
MHITSLAIHAFRSFADLGSIEFSSMNVLLGANNSGKSTILKALHLLQQNSVSPSDVRLAHTEAVIRIGLAGITAKALAVPTVVADTGVAVVELKANAERSSGSVSLTLGLTGGAQQGFGQIPNRDPDHLIIPFYSKRKTVIYSRDVSLPAVRAISGSLEHLSAKLSRLANPHFPGYAAYSDACQEILGFVVTAISADGGQEAGVYIDEQTTLPMSQMGEGVPNIVGFLSDLATAQGKVFLIEEPENDLHPAALKALLELIKVSSQRNQFFVSTHSSIVVRHLGSLQGCRLFNITAPRGQLPPVSEISLVENTASARLEVLRNLGYELSDFDLWDGWLVLEEASAERVIIECLIPHFAPRMTRVRTISARGIAGVEPAFHDLHRLVLFTHLEAAYTGRCWVRVDGDAPGNETVLKLRRDFPTWPQGSFETFGQEDFERYYPSVFQETVDTVLGIADRQEKRRAKKELLLSVLQWFADDVARGTREFEVSASEIIASLRRMEARLQ